MHKLTIVVAVHNQLEYNRLFLDSLEKYSALPCELVVVDNASNDGSTTLFREHGATVLRNEENHCYGCSQNQGVAYASTEYVACLNNDLCLSPSWDARLIEHMERFGLDVICPCGIETMESAAATRAAMRKWRFVNSLQRARMALGLPYRMNDLRFLVKLMYGNWETFIEKRRKRFGNFLYPGISGNAVVARKRLFEKIGLWSTDVGGSDWDFQLRLIKRQAERGDVAPSVVAGDVFVHHFIRATLRTVKRQSWCSHPLRDITEAWSAAELVYLHRPALSVVITAPSAALLEAQLAALAGGALTDPEIVIAEENPSPETLRCLRQWAGRFNYPIVQMATLGAALGRARSDYLMVVGGEVTATGAMAEKHAARRRIGQILQSAETLSVYKGDIFRLLAQNAAIFSAIRTTGELLTALERSGMCVKKIA
jgi:GT2 family glycosyltransferase